MEDDSLHHQIQHARRPGACAVIICSVGSLAGVVGIEVMQRVDGAPGLPDCHV